MLIGDEILCIVIPAHHEHWVLICRKNHFFHPGLLQLREPDDRVAIARIHNTFPKPAPGSWNKTGGDLCFEDSRSIAQPELDSGSRVMYEGDYYHEKGGER